MTLFCCTLLPLKQLREFSESFIMPLGLMLTAGAVGENGVSVKAGLSTVLFSRESKFYSHYTKHLSPYDLGLEPDVDSPVRATVEKKQNPMHAVLPYSRKGAARI